MTPTERARLREQCRRYGSLPWQTAEYRNLQALLAAAVPRLLDEIDRLERLVAVQELTAKDGEP